MSIKDSTEALIKLGFTGLEAEAYTALLQQSTMTGYGVAQMLGKPVANVYKTLESLQNKGAIIADEGSNRVYRAVPAGELLSRLQRNFLENKQQAEESLAKIQNSSVDERVYQLRSRGQVFELCRRMLADCRQIVLLEVFPLPLVELLSDIEAAIARGVQVVIKVYQPIQIDGAEIFFDSFSEIVMERWQEGQWLNVVTDASEHLLAFLTADGKEVHQAIWSSSAYLSCVYHSTFGSELVLTGLLNHIEQGASAKQLQKLAKRYFQLTAPKAAGYQALMERFGKTRSLLAKSS